MKVGEIYKSKKPNGSGIYNSWMVLDIHKASNTIYVKNSPYGTVWNFNIKQFEDLIKMNKEGK